MRLGEAISAIDSIKPNDYTQVEKVKWISRLDGIVKQEVIDTHHGSCEHLHWHPYSEHTSMDTVLLVGEPYDDMYLAYLESQIDYANGEIVKYNNSVVRFNDLFSAYKRWYNSVHMPNGKHIIYF